MKTVAIGLVACLACFGASAQDRVFLGKPEVQQLADAKKWRIMRKTDGNTAIWDLSSGGRLYGRNVTTQGSDNGNWTVNDSGQLCVKWRGSSQDRCVAVLKDGADYKLVDAGDLAGEYAALVIE